VGKMEVLETHGPLMLLNLSARYTNFNKPSKVPLFASPENPWRLTELSMDLCVKVGASLERTKGIIQGCILGSVTHIQ
jgi:hypothetical protein